jgi:predicted DsbA family dithiol-disulfide isomerase
MQETHARAAIDVFADLTCPWCFVGWEALKQAARATPEVKCSVAWRSFLLHPDMPAEGVDRRAFLRERFGDDPERAAAIRAGLMAAATEAGAPLDLGAAERLPSSVNAHRLIHWAAGQGRAETCIDVLFEAYWVNGLDIGQADVLAAAAEAAGMDGAMVADLLAGEADRDLIHEYHTAAARAGVQGVPVVIVNRKAVLMGAEAPAVYQRAIRDYAA